MLSYRDFTIVAPYFSRSSRISLLYRAIRSFVCRFVRVGLFVPIRMSVICLSIRMSVRQVVSVFVDIRVGFVCRNCFSETEFEKGAVERI